MVVAVVIIVIVEAVAVAVVATVGGGGVTDAVPHFVPIFIHLRCKLGSNVRRFILLCSNF